MKASSLHTALQVRLAHTALRSKWISQLRPKWLARLLSKSWTTWVERLSLCDYSRWVWKKGARKVGSKSARREFSFSSFRQAKRSHKLFIIQQVFRLNTVPCVTVMLFVIFAHFLLFGCLCSPPPHSLNMLSPLCVFCFSLMLESVTNIYDTM